jgi:tetratricopeptide (TPR) repeat protein/ABC-type iron transport system FetAB ATPase subunit
MNLIEYKYNIGFLLDEDLLRAFVVRRNDLKLLLDVVAGNTGSTANRHLIIIGPRGLGKTTLLRAIAASVRLNPDLSANWYPVVYGEESYNVTSAGEFWLECIYHIQKQENTSDLEQIYNNLRKEPDEDVLRERCLNAVMEVSRRMGHRLLLCIENLNMLFEDQIEDKEGWSIRYALQNCPEIMLLGTATTHFDQIDNVESALFEQFKVHYLEPLSVGDCRRLWSYITGIDISSREIRPVHILTGGNPRLIQIWAEFASNTSFKDTIDKLSRLVDDYTDYFKSQLDCLSPQERKVFVGLLELWDPSTTRQIAELARTQVNATSSVLARLEKRGAIIRDRSSPPRWQVAERLFNIYYLMRRRGTAADRVQALVKFMTVYYHRDQLVERVAELAREACGLEPNLRRDHYVAVEHLLEEFGFVERGKVFQLLPSAFLAADDLPASIRALCSTTRHTADALAKDSKNAAQSKRTLESLRRVVELLENDRADEATNLLITLAQNGNSPVVAHSLAIVYLSQNKLEDAEKHARAAIATQGSPFNSWLILGKILERQEGRLSDAIAAFRKAIAFEPLNAEASERLGDALLREGTNVDDARTALRKVTKLAPQRAVAWSKLGQALDLLGRYREAEVAFKRAINLDESNANAWGAFGTHIMRARHNLAEAEHAFRRVLEYNPETIAGRLKLANVISHFPERAAEARELYSQAMELSPEDEVRAPIEFSRYLRHRGDLEQARLILERAVTAAPRNPEILAELASVLEESKRPTVEVEQALLRAISVARNAGRYWVYLGIFLSRLPNKESEAENAFRKATTASPGDCAAWFSLGRFYLSKGRVTDAETAFRVALDQNPRYACALPSLVKCIEGSTGSAENIIALLSRTLEADPNNGGAHFLLGKQLWRLNREVSGAQAELVAAIRKGAPASEVWDELVSMILASYASKDAIIAAFMEVLRAVGRNPSAWNSVAWRIHRSQRADLADFAVDLAQRAVDDSPDTWAFQHTLVATLVDADQLDRALALVLELSKLASDEELGDFIELCVAIARLGRSRDLVTLLEASSNAKSLEPLMAALRIVSGDAIHIAEEVRQVAQDIVGQITAE